MASGDSRAPRANRAWRKAAIAVASLLLLAGLGALAWVALADNETAKPNVAASTTPLPISTVDPVTPSPAPTPTLEPPLLIAAADWQRSTEFARCAPIGQGGLSPGIYTMDIGQCGRGQLTDGAEDNDVAWSSDEEKLAFLRWNAPRGSVQATQADIYVLDSLGSTPRAISGVPDDPKQSISWSPDGTLLAFQSFQDWQNRPLDLAIVHTDGSGGYRMLFTGSQPIDYDWAPDGKSLVVVAGGSGGRSLLLVPIDGGPTRAIASDATGAPAWSPDATFIAYNCHVEGLFGNTGPAHYSNEGEVCVVTPQGSQHRVITKRLDSVPFSSTSQWAYWHPAWTADGTVIFAGLLDRSLHVVEPRSGREVVTVTNAGLFELFNYLENGIVTGSGCVNINVIPCGPVVALLLELSSGQVTALAETSCAAPVYYGPTGRMLAFSVPEHPFCPP
jgi:dipeptidyl aminopeptidase/acylaminoacyl peptidase